MSFKGKVVKTEKIDTPIGKVTLETKEYEKFPKRSKIIFWLGQMQVVKLGELITVYHPDPKRKSDFEPMKWVPLYYVVKVTDDADASDVEPYFFLPEEIEEKGKYEFDDKEKAMEFAEGLKCVRISMGGVSIDSKADFERWQRVMEKVAREDA